MPTAEYAPREIVGSKAFNLEYERTPSRQSVREDIVAYLGEYRFKIPKFNYNLYFVPEIQEVVDAEGESMVTKAKRTLAERSIRGDPIHRETGELLGLESFTKQLSRASKGDSVFWASPPGPRDEGYGDYGFVYSGEMGDYGVLATNKGEKLLAIQVPMTAMRVENPTIEQYNAALNELSGLNVNFREADDYLSAPFIRRVSPNVDGVLRKHFAFQDDEEESRRFRKIIKILEPLIDRTVYAIQNGSSQEKLETFYALENYSIELRDKAMLERIEYDFGIYNVDDIVSSKGSRIPPQVLGSCGSTSNMLFASDSAIGSLFLTPDEYGKRDFNCPNPRCGKLNIRPGGELIKKCQHCGADVTC